MQFDWTSSEVKISGCSQSQRGKRKRFPAETKKKTRVTYKKWGRPSPFLSCAFFVLLLFFVWYLLSFSSSSQKHIFKLRSFVLQKSCNTKTFFWIMFKRRSKTNVWEILTLFVFRIRPRHRQGRRNLALDMKNLFVFFECPFSLYRNV
jgi:hypothetical protein